MIFRQLFEPVSSTYTYLLGCENTGQAVLVDPVINSIERDLVEVSKLGMTLAYTVDTHIHTDHITSALELRNKVGSKIVTPAMERLNREITLDQFQSIMENLNLPYPKFIDYAVPGNKQRGICPTDLPDKLKEYCEQMSFSQQG